MINDIRINLLKDGYRKVDVNASNIYLQYVVLGNDAFIVALIDNKSGRDFLEEQYINIAKQIKNKFSEKMYSRINFLIVTFTDDIEYIKNFNTEGYGHWIINQKDSKLVIFENQPFEFLNVKQHLESILENHNNGNNINKSESNHDNLEKRKKQFYNNKKKSQFSISVLIILINVIVFIGCEIKGNTMDTQDMLRYGASYWPYVTRGEYYRLFTYMFLHFGISHLINNMIILAFIGNALETVTGKIKYLIIYLGSGVVAGLASLGYNMHYDLPVVSAGASGAIFGVVGALLYIVIKNKGRIQEISAMQLLFFLILSLYGGFISAGTDNTAHIGGLISGFIIAGILYKKPKNGGVY